MSKDRKILDELVSCTLRGAIGWGSDDVFAKLKDIPEKLKSLKEILPHDEYQSLVLAYVDYKKSANSSVWWSSVNKLIKVYEDILKIRYDYFNYKYVKK